jgi:BirA family transcriptional regulator, biotin operon repressor / biotin---[acetyl-CoA-carboxylase] ligase
MTDPLSENILEGALRGRLGRTLRFLDTTTSTNTVALEWAASDAPEGALVVAEHQTAGRGRWGRSWLSEPGAGLLFSLVLRPTLSLHRSALITTALGVACAEAIERTTNLHAHLKWPNDITVEQRKLGGILVETRVDSGRLDVAVAGVGLNVHRRPAAIRGKISDRVSSVATEIERAGLGAPPSRAELLAAILEAFEEQYGALSDDVSAAAVVERAAARSEILGNGVRVRFANGQAIEGRAVRLLPSGALEIEAGDKLIAVDSGEVEQLRYGAS